jgi:hypothetical protein
MHEREPCVVTERHIDEDQVRALGRRQRETVSERRGDEHAVVGSAEHPRK